MGAVWSAANVQTGKEFAIKFLHPLIASSSDDARQRFLQEARASARMNHPNIIDIFDVGETDDGSLFLVMELLDGLSLQDAMRADPPFSARELIAIAKGAATALAVAHAAGIVHRDVKPPNIFLCRERGGTLVRPKLLDFGVSKVPIGDDGIATHTGSLLGSPRYMAPEQAVSASQADGRADLWSLGVILYEGLTGVFPHDGDNSNAIVIAIAMRPPKPITEVAPFLPQAVREIVDDCLKPVANRVQSATVLADRLQLILDSHDLSDVPLARPAHAKKVVPRPDNFVIQTVDSSSGGVMLASRMSLASLPPPPAPASATPLPSVKPPDPLPTQIIAVPEPAVDVRSNAASIGLRPPPRPAAPQRPMDDEDATIVRDPRELQALTAGMRASAPTDPKLDAQVERHSLSDETTNSDNRLRESAATVVVATRPAALAPIGEATPPASLPMQPPADPGESISSINVSRGLSPFGSMPPTAQQTFLSDPPEPPLKSNRRLVMGMAAVGAAALLGIVVVLSTGGSPDAGASSAQAADKGVAADKPADTAKVQATPLPSASEPAPSASAPASAAASAKSSDSARPQSGSQTSGGQTGGGKPKPKSTGTDPLRDLGSGITLQPRKK